MCPERTNVVCVKKQSDFPKELQFNRNLLKMPNVANILLDCTVGSELAGLGNIENCHLSPAVFVAVCFLDALLRCLVGAEILENEVLVGTLAAVAVEKRVLKLAEQLRILRRIEAVYELREHQANVLIGVVDLAGLIAAVVLVVDDLIGA